MAQLSYYSFYWVGSGFNPGTDGIWLVYGLSYPQVVGVTAQAVAGGGIVRDLMVREVHAHVDANGNRALIVMIRNTGANYIPGYTVNISYVTP